MGIELIHADGQLRELEEITALCRFDAQLSTDPDGDNDWMIELPESVWKKQPLEKGHYLYIPGTEWGGPAERVSNIGRDGTVRVYGTCWRGLLARKVISPPAGQTHLVITNTEANSALASLLGRWGGGLFTVSQADSGLVCSASLRYRTLIESAYMLLNPGGTLSISFGGGAVSLGCLPVRDLSESVELSQDYSAVLDSDSTARKFNHIIALGQGEMLERTVIELWLLPDGAVTDDPSAEGVPPEASLSTILYDYPAVESADELRAEAARKLRAAAGSDSLELELFDYDSSLRLGDMVSARDSLTGMAARLAVSGTLLRLTADGISLRHTLKQEMN